MCELDPMTRAKGLRTLEELWDLEDRYPFVDSSAGGLLRWMAATRPFAKGPSKNSSHTRRTGRHSRPAGNLRS
jgi:hypothetical protein